MTTAIPRFCSQNDTGSRASTMLSIENTSYSQQFLSQNLKLSNARNLTNHFILHRSSCPIDAGAVMVAKGLHYFNSVLNPIIYSLMNKQFKTAFKHLFYLTYSNLSGRGPMMTRLDVDKQLSFTYFSSLKSRSSMQEKSRAEENNLPQRV